MQTPARVRERTCIRLLAVLALALGAAPARAQDPAAPGPTPITTVRGVVHDSIAAVPLVGATVQLASIENPAAFIRVADTDLRGRFRVNSVPPGRYMLGFLHPMLDSPGLDPPLRMVTIADTAEVIADLAIPAPAQLRLALCGTCSPGVYIDGMRLDGADTADIDSWVRPEELAGMEVYSVATVPAQYQTLNGCGAILLWTK